MRVCFILIILFSKFCISQSSPKFSFDYTNYAITNVEKTQHKIIESFLINNPFFLEYHNILKKDLSNTDFDINQNKLVKKISVYKKNPSKVKLFEIDFYQNGKIKSLTDSEIFVYTFEYNDTLEVRKTYKNDFEINVDSIFFDEKGKIIQTSKYSKNNFNDAFEKENNKFIYDKSDRLILKYKIKNVGFSESKVSYFREICKFNYYQDSIIEKIFSNKENDILLNNEKCIFNDTIKINNDFTKVYYLDKRKRINQINYKIINNDNTISQSNYFITFDSNDKITSLKKENNIFYKFSYDKKGSLKKALFIPNELIDVYEYDDNGYLLKANNDLFFYKYDKFGNWVNYEVKRENQNSHLLREIEYY